MKKAGAQFIIYIDVISKGKFLLQNHANSDQVRALWSGIKASSRQQQKQANAVIEVPLEMDLSDFEQRREAMAAGERAGNAALNDILTAIGLVTEPKAK